MMLLLLFVFKWFYIVCIHLIEVVVITECFPFLGTGVFLLGQFYIQSV